MGGLIPEPTPPIFYSYRGGPIRAVVVRFFKLCCMKVGRFYRLESRPTKLPLHQLELITQGGDLVLVAEPCPAWFKRNWESKDVCQTQLDRLRHLYGDNSVPYNCILVNERSISKLNPYLASLEPQRGGRGAYFEIRFYPVWKLGLCNFRVPMRDFESKIMSKLLEMAAKMES